MLHFKVYSNIGLLHYCKILFYMNMAQSINIKVYSNKLFRTCFHSNVPQLLDINNNCGCTQVIIRARYCQRFMVEI